MKDSNEQLSIRHSDVLKQFKPDELPDFLYTHRNDFLTSPRPFADYMRAKFKEKGMLQQNIFLAADISENYGYKLIAEEKHTVNRDVILRVCLAAHFDLAETQEALILYGMPTLYDRLPRDIVFIVAINNRLFDIYQVNSLLIECAQIPMISET